MSGADLATNAAVLLPVVQPPDLSEHSDDTFFFQQTTSTQKHSFKQPRARKTTIPVNTVNPHPKFLAYFQKTELGKRKGLESLTPNELVQISSNLPSDLQQELLNEDDGGENDRYRNSQKFKFEQCKQAAFSLLANVAFVLDQFGTLNEEEQIVPEDLQSLMLESLDELSAGVVYEHRDWQTQAYKDEATALEKDRDRNMELLTPTFARASPIGDTPVPPQHNLFSKTVPKNVSRPASVANQHPSHPGNLSIPVPSMPTLAEQLSRPGTTASEYLDTLGPLPSAQTISKLKAATLAHHKVSGRTRRTSRDSSDESETGSRRSKISTRSGRRGAGGSVLNWAEQSSLSDQIVTLNFSLESKECEEKGWIVHSEGDSSAEDRRFAAVTVYRLVSTAANKIKEEHKARQNTDTNQLQIDYWGNKKMNLRNQKRQKALDVHGGDNRLLPWPIVPENLVSQAFTGYICLPDGSQSINYKNGQLAVLFDRPSPSSNSFFCSVFSEEGHLQALFVPGCRGTVTPLSHSSPTLVLSQSGGTLYSNCGDRERVFTWPLFANKLLDPVTLRINDKVAIRVLNHNNVVLMFSYHSEKYKINIAKQNEHFVYEDDKDAVPYLLTDFKFLSKTAHDLESPKRKGRQSRMKSSTNKRPVSENTESSGLAVKGLDLPGTQERAKFENDLISLQVRVEYLLEEWLEFYRIHLGIPSPMLKNMRAYPVVHKRGFSAKSTPAAALRVLEDLIKLRSHSAAAKLKYLPPKTSMSARDISEIKRTASVPPIKLLQYQQSHANSLAPTTPMSMRSKTEERLVETARRAKTERLERKTNLKVTRELTQLIATDEKQQSCPVTLRAKLTGLSLQSGMKCICSPYRPPEVRDTEFDYFIGECVPSHQIVVVILVDHREQSWMQGREMFDNIYARMSRNRTSPCFQSKMDPFRIVYYDTSNAHLTSKPSETTSTGPSDPLTSLLQMRHRVHAGMMMMFCGSKLYFADEIFNGYGVSRHDFFSQLEKTKRDIDKGDWLPDDYKFTFHNEPSKMASIGESENDSVADDEGQFQDRLGRKIVSTKTKSDDPTWKQKHKSPISTSSMSVKSTKIKTSKQFSESFPKVVIPA